MKLLLFYLYKDKTDKKVFNFSYSNFILVTKPEQKLIPQIKIVIQNVYFLIQMCPQYDPTNVQ